MNIDKIVDKLRDAIESQLIDAETKLILHKGQLQGVELLYEEIRREAKRVQPGSDKGEAGK